MEPSEILDAAELDDDRDRDELRSRYGMLLQELRVLLPGVQLLVAFLLTAPFAQGFERVDDLCGHHPGHGRADGDRWHPDPERRQHLHRRDQRQCRHVAGRRHKYLRAD